MQCGGGLNHDGINVRMMTQFVHENARMPKPVRLVPEKGAVRRFRHEAAAIFLMSCLAIVGAGCDRKDGVSPSGGATTNSLSSNATVSGPSAATGDTNDPAGQSMELPEDPVELVNIGNQMLARGRPSSAIPFYARALEKNPEDEEVHFNLGYAFAKIGRTNEAVGFYTRALEIFPDYVEAHNNLGNLYVSMKQYGQAMEHFTAALNVLPDHASALNNMGRCFAAQGQLEEALGQFTQALQSNPDYMEARYNLGMTLLNLEQFDEAILEFQSILRREPDFKPAQFGLSRAQALKQSP